MAERQESTDGTETSENRRQKNFKKLVGRFCDKTSMQGVGYIRSARLTASKLIWTGITIGSVIAMAYHVSCIVAHYRSWPKQTVFSLNFDDQQLPDITICHLNPIRESKVKGLKNAKTLQDFLAKTDKSMDEFWSWATAELKPDAYTEEGTNDYYDYRVPGTDDAYVVPETDVDYLMPENIDGYKIPGTSDGLETVDDYIMPENTDGYRIPGMVDRLETVHDYEMPENTNGYRIPGTADDSKIPDAYGDYILPGNTDGQIIPVNTGDQKVFPRTANVTKESQAPQQSTRPATGDASDVTVSPTDGQNDSMYADEMSDAFQEALRYLFDAQELLDSERKSSELFKMAYMELSRADRAAAGHQMDDMLVNCSFGGQSCNASMFTLHQDADFGNCWTLSGADFLVHESGPRGGLSLVLFLENHELVDRITQGHGVRLVIHDRGSLAVPSSEGIFVSAGHQTDIGLRSVEVNRLGHPYGECNTGSVFRGHFNASYTRQGCIRLCEVSHVLVECGCYNANDEELVHLILDQQRPYTSCKTQQEFECMINSEDAQKVRHHVCACDNPCTEKMYTQTSSFALWPSDVYVAVLENIICDRADNNDCKSLSELEVAGKSKNFLKLRIYYEDLNFEVIEEVPEITFFQFLSDIGGAVGLWIGLSLISLLEILQLLIEMYDFAIHKSIQKSDKHKEKVKLKRSMSQPSNDTNDPTNGDIENADAERADEPGLFGRVIAILTRGRTLGIKRRKHMYTDYEAAYEPVSVT